MEAISLTLVTTGLEATLKIEIVFSWLMKGEGGGRGEKEAKEEEEQEQEEEEE